MPARPPAHPGVRFPPPLLFVAGLLGGLALDRLHHVGALGAGPAAEGAGVALVVLGLAMVAWGMGTFRRARTAILPNRPASGLVMDGPYRFTRNPMYVGLTGAYAGLALVLNTAWPFLLLPAVLATLVATVIRREERYLARAFGSAYDAYQARVRRWL